MLFDADLLVVSICPTPRFFYIVVPDANPRIPNPTQVARWALLSCAAVYKDVLPSYRIRLPTEKELAMPVSKEVRKLREYESALLRGYQTYLKHLLKVWGWWWGIVCGVLVVGILTANLLVPS